MSALRRHARLVLQGQARGLAERFLARLPLARPLSVLPDFPPYPTAPCIRDFTARRPLKLLAAGSSLRLDGASISQFELLTALAKDGAFDITLASQDDGPLREAYLRQGISVRLGLPSLSSIRSGRAFTDEAMRFARSFDLNGFDLVFANTLLTAVAVEAARLCGVPALWNIRESLPPHLAFRPFGKSVANRALACFRHPFGIIFVAKASERLWKDILGPKAITIPNALGPQFAAALDRSARDEARDNLGIGSSEVVVVCPGTICARKGQRTLVKALRLMPKDASDRLCLILAGDANGVYAQKLLDDLSHLPGSRFRLLPARAEMAPLYRAADILVLTSRNESAPRVVLEAMAAGLALVVSPVFGIVEQTRDSDAAIFCPPDSPAQLALRLTQLMAQPELRRQLGLAARRRFEDWNDFPAMVGRYRDILLAQGSAPDLHLASHRHDFQRL